MADPIPLTPASPASASKCPICRKPSQPAFKPFCSRRCADVDLGRWFNESYRTPGEPVESQEIEPEE